MTATVILKLFFVEFIVVIFATIFNLTVAELFTLLGLLALLSGYVIKKESEMSKFKAELKASNDRIDVIFKELEGKANHGEVLRQHNEVKEAIADTNTTVKDIYQILINRN